MEKRIFISHSSKDHETASIICDALEKNGLLCWIAPRDIPYGKEWAGEISKAIENSSAFLFLSSGNSNASGQVSREIQLAIENEVPIIPIRLDGADYSDTNKYYLATIHCMFQYDASKITKLVSDISAALPQPAKQTEEKPSKEKKVKKPRYGMKLSLCGVLLWLCTLCAVLTFVLSDLEMLYKAVISAFAVIIGSVPFAVMHHKAVKSFKINRKTVNGLTAVFLCTAVLFVGGGFALDNYLWYSDLDTKFHIVLTAPETMTAAEFKQATDTVKERVGIISDGNRYTADINGDKIELIIPRESFADIPLYDMLKCYISRATNLFFTTNTYYDTESGKDIIQYVEIPREKIESVTLRQGQVPGVEDITKYGIESNENYEYIEIVIDEAFIRDNKDTLDFYGDRLVLAQDKAGYSSYYYYHTFRGKKSNVFYIVNVDKHPTVSEAVVYNLTHEPLPDSLSIETDIAAVWEDVSSAETKGENQCNASKLKGETVTFKYVSSSYSEVSEGEWLDTVRSYKARLDALGQPYAFGSAFNEPHSITVRTSAEKMNEGIMRLLCSSRPVIRGDYTVASIPTSYSDEKLLKVISDDKGIRVEITAPDEDTERVFRQISEFGAESDAKRLYIVEERTDTALLSGVASKKNDGKTLVFDEIAAMPEKAISEESRWLADLVEAVYNNPPAATLTFEEYKFSSFAEDEKQSFSTDKDTTELEEKISAIADVRFVEQAEGNLRVGLDLPVDEKLPENAIEAAKKIYELTDFENSVYKGLNIYLITEDGDERVRIFFVKHYETIASYKEEFKNGFVYAHGIFQGGRVERDKEEFIKLISEDEFFKKMDHREDGMLWFDTEY